MSGEREWLLRAGFLRPPKDQSLSDGLGRNNVNTATVAAHLALLGSRPRVGERGQTYRKRKAADCFARKTNPILLQTTETETATVKGIWFCYTTDKKLGSLSAVKQCGGRRRGRRRKKAIDVHGIEGLTGESLRTSLSWSGE